MQQEWKPFAANLPCVLCLLCVRIHALCALRLPACCSHGSLLLPREAATRSQLVSKQPLALPTALASLLAKSAAHRLQRMSLRLAARGACSNSKGKGNSANAVACAPLYPRQRPQPAQCRAERSARRAKADRCTTRSRPPRSGAGGGGLFVARMGRLFLAPSKKFLNFSSASPAHCSPHSCTLQPATAPAAAPTAAGHTGGIGHRGRA